MDPKKEKVRILIVEDSPTSRDAAAYLVATAFKNFGFSTRIFLKESAKKALDFIEELEKPLDFIFVAIRCNPSSSQERAGYEVVLRTKEKMPRCVAFMMTKMLVTDQIFDEIVDCGAIDYVAKPVGIRPIQCMLEMYLNVADTQK